MTITPPTKRKNKVATTIRLDPDLKEWAREYAHHAGIDLSTFITVTLTQVKHTGKPVEMYDPKILEYNKYLDGLIADAEKGINVSEPFSTREELEGYFDTLMK